MFLFLSVAPIRITLNADTQMLRALINLSEVRCSALNLDADYYWTVLFVSVMMKRNTVMLCTIQMLMNAGFVILYIFQDVIS